MDLKNNFFSSYCFIYSIFLLYFFIISCSDTTKKTISSQDDHQFFINENVEIGTSVGFINLKGATISEYHIRGGESTQNAFIVESTGEIIVNRLNDYEAIEKYEIDITLMNSDQSTKDFLIAININDVDEIPPTVEDFIVDLELDIANNNVVANVIARHDENDINRTSPLHYQIDPDLYNGLFIVDQNSGAISITRNLFPNATSYILILSVTDNLNNRTFAIGRFNVVNIMSFFIENQIFTVNENVETDTLVGTIKALDDFTINNYTIISGNETSKFDINNAGEITTTSTIDFEMMHLYNLIVRAVNSSGTSTDITVTINVIDIAEFTAQIENNNPFNTINVGERSAPTFNDVDGDNDLDLIIGDDNGNIHYYKNNNGTYVAQTGSTANPFHSIDVGFRATPTFVDVDKDNDLDLIIGEFDGNINYYSNQNDGIYKRQMGSDNPFDHISLISSTAPTFNDVDGDNDLDLIIGDNNGNIHYYKNNNGTYVAQTGSTANPFHSIDVGFQATPTFVDVDKDNDLDLIIGQSLEGSINYYKNDNGTYIAQTGQGINPFHTITNGNSSTPTFADIDGDSMLDLIIGEFDGNINYYKRN